MSARISLEQLLKMAQKMAGQTTGATKAGYSQKQIEKILDEVLTPPSKSHSREVENLAYNFNMHESMAMPYILQQILKGGGSLRLPQQPNRSMGDMMRMLGEQGSMPGSQF
tara:strand:- start:1110 stop:1442 length:333 start_codon:yes stop_codon:yes gene_type:complete